MGSANDLGGGNLQENHLATCLEAAFKNNAPKQRRQALVVRIPDWQLLEKSWRPLLLLALAETELPSADEDGESTPRRRSSSARNRSRRGGRGVSDPMDSLPSALEMLLPSDYSDAFRLAVLLVHKLLNKDDWDTAWESTETTLRTSCLEKGVHPVWHDMALRTPLLGQFAGFPKAKVSAKNTAKKVSLDLAYIDPFSSQDLIVAIESIAPSVTDAETQVALRGVVSQLSSGRQLQPAQVLYDMKSSASALSYLFALATGHDSSNAEATLSKIDAELTSQLNDYRDLRNGILVDWNASRNADGDGSLSNARRLLAWQNAPAEAANLSSTELAEGLEILKQSSAHSSHIEKIMWWRLLALESEGLTDEAVLLLTSLKLDSHTEISTLLPLLVSLSSNEVDEWLHTQIPHLDDGALVSLIQTKDISSALRLAASNRLSVQEGEAWESVLPLIIDIYTESMQLKPLAHIITSNSLIPLSHPYETLLVSHLLDAGHESNLWEQVRAARRTALSSIYSTDAPESFSSTSQALLMLFEGENFEDNRLTTVLDRQGLRAFGPIRQALRDGGTGIVSSTNLANLEESISSADLTVMERRLFTAVIATLRLNHVALMLQHATGDESTIQTLNTLLSGDQIPTGMIHTVRHLVLEHDIGLPSLVRWYQTHDALSPWHILARAAVSASKNDELNAARDYRRAGDHDAFDYEHSLTLYRKALIHLALAEQWKEAVELLDAQPALRSAITRRFQLYLQVSYTARAKDTNSATRILKDFVKRTKVVTEEDEQGNMVEVTKVYHAEDDLDMLKTYPLEHPRPLPTHPFCGRVTAASSSLHKNHRRQKNTFDIRFNQLMQSGSPTAEEVHELAIEASKVRPVDGLMFLERAQNSEHFSESELRALAGSEKALFSQYRSQIPNASRRYLRNLSLSPLVIIDTNILVDALIDRIGRKLHLVGEASLDILGQGGFHKVLLSKAKEGRLHLWLPSIVKQELTGIATNTSMLRNRFDDALVSQDLLDEVFKPKVLDSLVNEVLSDYDTWSPLDLEIEKDSNSSENRATIQNFLLDYTEIYEEITDMKRTRGEPVRTVINGKDIYPESPDRTLMCIATQLASQSLQDLGTVLVATRDGDFTLVGRAFEERFGFGVAKNSRSLNAWLR